MYRNCAWLSWLSFECFAWGGCRLYEFLSLHVELICHTHLWKSIINQHVNYLSNLLITAHNSRNNCSNNDTHDFVYFDGHHRHHHHHHHHKNNNKNPVNLLLLFFKTIIPMIIFPTINSKTNVFHTFSYKQFAPQAAANTVKRPCRQCRHRSHLASLTWPELSHQVAFKPHKISLQGEGCNLYPWHVLTVINL